MGYTPAWWRWVRQYFGQKPLATWQKRFFQRHYSYRDSHTITTTTLTENAMLALVAAGLATSPSTTSSNVYYVFGTNARLVTNPTVLPWGTAYGTTAWPALCFVRNILLRCEENAFIKIVSLNPAYLESIISRLYTGEPTTVSTLIFEREMPLLAGNWHRFFPTYGYALCFRAPITGNAGELTIEVEGNVEGGE